MNRSTTGSAGEEFRDVARDALKLGGRCIGAARDWLGEKREEFDLGRAAGRSGVSVHGYRGVGPRGYRRDDARIHDDVCDALADNDALDAGDITVEVTAGVVRLAGSVPHRMMKRLAEELAEGCSGVRDVENALRVGPPPHMGGATAGTASSTGTAGSASAGAGGTYGADPSPAGSSSGVKPSGPSGNF